MPIRTFYPSTVNLKFPTLPAKHDWRCLPMMFGEAKYHDTPKPVRVRHTAERCVAEDANLKRRILANAYSDKTLNF